MSASWPKFIGKCKSRLSAIARNCFLGRHSWYEKCKEAKELLEASRAEVAKLQVCCAELKENIVEMRERIAELELEGAQPKPMEWPVGAPPAGQQFGAGMIALCVNLARKIGLRPSEQVLHIFSEWMNVKVRIPKYQTIRGWMQRIGLDRMENAKKISNGIWLADHTNQIGKEKVLTVMRVRGSLPRPGVPLRHRDVDVLALVPGTEWKRDDVAKIYQETANRVGVPRAVESDGAVELREPVETLGKSRKKPIVIRDLKHFLANQFEGFLNKDPQYQKFVQKVGWARSALQQTELAHFIPPGVKAKSRFMNLAPTLKWATTMLWHLEHPQSQSREGVTESRMEEKMGWLRGFADSIQRWQECQQVISTGLTLINEQGIFRGVARQFKTLAADLCHHPMSQKLVCNTVEFIRAHEKKLRSGERLPMSTEILESSFSRYKHFEKQHSKSGFSSLLLTFPTLLRKTTTQEVKASFARVHIADVKAWVKKYLPSTIASKRQLVFRESRSKIKMNTETSATPLPAAV